MLQILLSLTQDILVFKFFLSKPTPNLIWRSIGGVTGMPSASLECVESCYISCQEREKCNSWRDTRCNCFTDDGDSCVCIAVLMCHKFSCSIIAVSWLFNYLLCYTVRKPCLELMYAQSENFCKWCFLNSEHDTAPVLIMLITENMCRSDKHQLEGDVLSGQSNTRFALF